MTETARTERAKAVAYLRRRQEEWWKQVQGYVAAGNHGPYLGAPSYGSMADDLEAGLHLKKPEPSIPAAEWVTQSNLTHGVFR